jgi:2-polyprenyl-3-methyl-5-hydroxy-6-metoxy-1,4-benzoquinol methylase
VKTAASLFCFSPHPYPAYDGGTPGRKRVLVFIPAYHAETTIVDVVRRIPASLSAHYDVDVLIIDDSSRDLTFSRSHEAARAAGINFDVRVLFNPVNQGYGGNQKIGYRYAIEKDYDLVALLHGDAQYAPECLPDLLGAFEQGGVAAVFGSRMLSAWGALRGGMPLYKFAGNRILTWIQNKLLRSRLSEFHSGYRVYAVEALRAIPFERNSNDFHFDTEIIIQLFMARRRIVELPIPTYYGDEICRVNGIPYAFNVVRESLKAPLQEMGIFYDRKYDCVPPDEANYTSKMDYASPHTMALERIREGSRVLDLGCAGGYMGAALMEQKHCRVTGVDTTPPHVVLDEFYRHNLNEGLRGIPVSQYDYVLLLDVIEHLSLPEDFLDELYRSMARNPRAELIVSTANIGFAIPRLMLLLGQFNYGKKGILDLTHTRLFTFGSFQRLLEQAGFEVCEVKGVPAPFPKALSGGGLSGGGLSRLLLGANMLLNRLSRGLFAYQIFMRVKARPTVEYLLGAAREESAKKLDEMNTGR